MPRVPRRTPKTVTQRNHVPIGLRYLALDAQGVQAVFIPAKDGDRIVVVAEPGRDADALWEALCAFMDEEEVPYSVRSQGLCPPAKHDGPVPVTRIRGADMPEGVRALAWMRPARIITYLDNSLSPAKRRDAARRVTLALRGAVFPAETVPELPAGLPPL